MSTTNQLNSLARLPRFRLLWRIVGDVEASLGSLPMVLVTPVVAALVGTVLAITQPALRVKAGVAEAPALGDSAKYAVFGSFGGILVVVLAITVWSLGRYRLLGDPVWHSRSADAAPDEVHPIMYFELRCASRHPIDPDTLGAAECVVRTPSGKVWSSTRIVKDSDGGRSLLTARFAINPEHGSYHCRWYSAPAGDRAVEVARSVIRYPGDFPILGAVG